MKYKIEFELPDNETVLREIKTEYVNWSVWGYSGIAKVQPVESKWIPCSERLPDQQTEVIYSYEQYVSTGYMTDRGYNGYKMELHWEDMESGALIYPEAWMPLPEGYQKGE